MRVVPWKIAAILGPAVLIAAFGFGLTRDPSRLPSAVQGGPAPNFELEALDGGRPLKLADFHGRALVINFWASWCVSCREEHETLVALGRAFAERDDIAVLGVNYRDTPRAAASFLERYGAYPYRSGIDPRGRIGIDYGVYGLPETYFVDAGGRIVERHIGPLDRAAAQRILARMGIPL